MSLTFLNRSRSRSITATLASRRQKRMVEPVLEQGAVRKSGQAVVEGKVLGLRAAGFEFDAAAPEAQREEGEQGGR